MPNPNEPMPSSRPVLEMMRKQLSAAEAVLIKPFMTLPRPDAQSQQPR